MKARHESTGDASRHGKRTIGRRAFLATSGLAAIGASGATRVSAHQGDDHRGVCVIASGNGLPATARAMELLRQRRDPAEAVVGGVKLVEDDPDDMSVGLGGLPNEEGVVTLDASVMHGPLHKAGSVAHIENIRNPAAVALEVLRRTDHVMLVGDGARRFAVRMGFEEENLLTERARRAWLKWRANLNDRDDWLDEDQIDLRIDEDGLVKAGIPFTHGTIHCSCVTEGGDLAGTTTTSGLSWKIPGRIGDSPIVGAGMYVDNEVGAAGATGRGEAVMQNCSAFMAVEFMRQGMTPTEACLACLKRMVENTRQRRLLDANGRVNYNVSMYAVRKDGAYGGGCIFKGGSFAVHDGEQNRRFPCVHLFER